MVKFLALCASGGLARTSFHLDLGLDAYMIFLLGWKAQWWKWLNHTCHLYMPHRSQYAFSNNSPLKGCAALKQGKHRSKGRLHLHMVAFIVFGLKEYWRVQPRTDSKLRRVENIISLFMFLLCCLPCVCCDCSAKAWWSVLAISLWPSVVLDCEWQQVRGTRQGARTTKLGYRSNRVTSARRLVRSH